MLMPLVNAAKVALGLGFVIFIHELGHFLLAKWNGVKVETFSIGFGPTLASYRPGAGFRIGTGTRAPVEGDPPGIGETEYVLAALPLGGYVKMLGEGIVEGVGEKNQDPRAYQNKSVWGRMGIISAGVIMNLILGVLCFAFVFSQGITTMPAKVGGVLAGSPAYVAGFRAGDEIVAIDGRRDVSYIQMQNRVRLSGTGQKLRFDLKRPGVPNEVAIEVEPRRGAGSDVPTIGVLQSSSLKLYPKDPYSPPPGVATAPGQEPVGFQGNDRVIAVGPEGGPLEAVADHESLVRKLDALRDVPIVVEVERPIAPPKDGGEDGTPDPAAPTKKARVTVPVHHFFDFGLRMTIGPIESIRDNSPAAKAGLKVGDRILAVDGNGDRDPMRLPDEIRGRAGQAVVLRLDRGGKQEDVTVTPDASPTWADPLGGMPGTEPLDIPGLGVAIRVDPKVQAVKEGSPGARAGIKAGDEVRAMIVTFETREKAQAKPETITFDAEHPAWASAFSALQVDRWKSVELLVGDAKKPIPVNPEVDPTWAHPIRGMNFQPLLLQLPPQGLVASIRSGAEETYDNIMGIYAMFRGLAQRRVGTKAMGGLPRIAQIAYQSASMGITPFIQFLGMLSVNLAVLNFLPIPPLDGGQMMFLIAEKVRGRPLPEAALSFGTVAGIVFVLGLILFINFQDVYLLAREYFS
ncbi:site-2 protease family protein [Tundrisphaera sp. TA3]|uniref:site-2 protease family protein n=1 Tax=Tundrisphaera sp. TA3 TaxID=3435775 RepID=UPI003EB8255D